jgi:hypothetical protein
MCRRAVSSSYFIIVFAILYLLAAAPAPAATQIETSQPHLRKISIDFLLDSEDIHLSPPAGGPASQLRFLNFGVSGEIGQPGLPFKGMYFEIPYGVEAKGVVIKQDWESLGTGFSLYPLQTPKAISLDEIPPFAKDEEFYQTDTFRPGELFAFSEPGYIRGRRILFVKVFPFQYNPVTGEIRYTRVLKIRINLVGKIEPFGEARKARLYAPGFNRLCSQLLENYEQANQGLEDNSHPLNGLPAEMPGMFWGF